MATTENLTNLNLNILTKEQYKNASIGENEMYLVTDDVMPIEVGGTGGKTAEEARVNLSVYSKLENDNAIETLNQAIGEKQSILTGATSNLTDRNLTSGLVLVSDSSGKVTTSLISTTELNYLDSVYDNIQDQLDDKLSCADGGTILGSLYLSKTGDASGNLNNEVALTIGNKNGSHIEFDSNEIMAKSDGTTPSNLTLNANGGRIDIGPGGLGFHDETAAKAFITYDSSLNAIVISFS